ncbi:hypothetical protein LZU85_19985 [Vibrio sp. IRLE0018]|uniref:DUF6602 domain-containing protein n=1 Tax=Vibrio floridensis TaxID=2908007 RepID=UPI001F2E8EE3|nr:DUF6602 domain-containing protein [Vibrio floridensis]MCF8781086.1 hypothetical protein [Vibrio floridensis]
MENYYTAIANMLLTEVELINGSFQHEGVKGSGNELALMNLLAKFLPDEYGIDTGIIVNQSGEQARQSDIIIYKKSLLPRFLSLTETKYFPVESVLVVIEVKTTLTKDAFAKATENLCSVKDIMPPGHKLAVIAFSFKSNVQSLETVNKWQKENIGFKIPYIFMLDHGFIKTPIETGVPEESLCHFEDSDEQFYTSEDSEYLVCFKKGARHWSVFNQSGSQYPLSKLLKETVVVDQAKVLACFLLVLIGLLESVQENSNVGSQLLKNYMPLKYKRFLVINEDRSGLARALL